MNLQEGSFIQWPLAVTWERQAWLLDVMYITWQTRQFIQRTKPASYKWTAGDINFDTWLQDGRPQREQLSEYEQWEREQ